MAVELGENTGLVVAVVIRLYFLFSCESQFVSGEFIEHLFTEQSLFKQLPFLSSFSFSSDKTHL